VVYKKYGHFFMVYEILTVTIIMLILTKCLSLLLTLVTLSVIFKIFYTSVRSDLVSRTVSTARKATQVIS
jgi:hypothetical protein